MNKQKTKDGWKSRQMDRQIDRHQYKDRHLPVKHGQHTVSKPYHLLMEFKGGRLIDTNHVVSKRQDDFVNISHDNHVRHPGQMGPPVLNLYVHVHVNIFIYTVYSKCIDNSIISKC